MKFLLDQGLPQSAVPRLGADAVVRLILSVVAACEADLNAGAVVTADTNRARVRRLPLTP